MLKKCFYAYLGKKKRSLKHTKKDGIMMEYTEKEEKTLNATL